MKIDRSIPPFPVGTRLNYIGNRRTYVGKVPILSMMVSPKGADIYKAACLMAGNYGFKLLPLDEQTDLVPDIAPIVEHVPVIMPMPINPVL